MDVFSHAAWGYAAARYKDAKPAWLGLLAGAGPDLAYFIPTKVEQILEKGWGGLKLGREPGMWRAGGPPLPPELVEAYHRYYVFTHSLVILGLVLGALYLTRKRQWIWLGLPWGLHILMDLPTHERYLTPIFFPISDWTMSFISWSDPRIFLPNLAALALAYGYLWTRRRNQAAQQRSVQPEHDRRKQSVA